MKPMSLLLCGIVVSSIVAIAAAQERPSGWGAKDGRALAAQRSGGQQQKGFTPPVPRGDLRGDIASNAHTRPDPPARNVRNNTLPRQ
ncbi:MULTISPECIES: hypothetical protein [Paraburkholderia]|uniref:hypothetical protein n=1 Tax=Paraburkholderia TaxID=1822464 RepID=UPI002259A9BC|nr:MULTISPECIES: hypothetical protein [Paraburkholderia]MCX4164409.1 hypothetical protein [Paraburkholderia megapolitana]MDN7159902.1 hypothetical protein [Paraburkholderia sp. CHISQ3]MDQ6496949.1 hypothetical protein [Paraburkholderia megapolitana]